MVMKTRYWVTLQMPVDVDETDEQLLVPAPQEALDRAWDRLLNSGEPPSGLVEHVSRIQPTLELDTQGESLLERHPAEESSEAKAEEAA
jgi:hypothetical protein